MKNLHCKLDYLRWRFAPKPRKGAGFTLMEMLVALGLFSVVVVIATDLFFTFQKISRKTESLQHLTSDARFITETIARYIRENQIDYNAYVIPIREIQSVLHLRTSAQDEIEIAASACTSRENLDFNCVTLKRDETTERLSGSEVWIRAMRFYIAPEKSPFIFNVETGEYFSNTQPNVTVFLSIANNADESSENYTKYDVQTTITGRIYAR